jgi:hypothetical protein
MRSNRTLMRPALVTKTSDRDKMMPEKASRQL